ncbi:ATP-binding cassette-type vacuolar membrane transporter Hmt1 [Sporothrix curviconia]|uniref:ATP-binding cassette-type vacuolar membrane transporter Hmt1 n=1 Tax=Sporothrix curviconia TaxID=1260050 RepID=A0ABP0C6L7_9PEZI
MAHPPPGRSWPEAIVFSLELWYGVFLLVIFVVSIVLNSIFDSRRAAQLIQPAATGPGGRPLPATRRRSQDSSTLSFTPTSEISNFTKRVYTTCYTFVIASFGADFASVLTHAFSDTKNPEIEFGWWCGEETAVYYMSGIFMHLYVLMYLVEGNRTPNRPVIIIWATTLVLEILIFTVNIIRLTGRHHVLRSIVLNIWTIAYGPDKWDFIAIGFGTFRLFMGFTLLGIYTSIAHSRNVEREKQENEAPAVDEGPAAAPDSHFNDDARTDERTPLLANNSSSRAAYKTASNGSTNGSANGSSKGHSSHLANGSANGSTNGSANGSARASGNGSAHDTSSSAHGQSRPTDNNEADETAFYRPKNLPHKTWWEYLSSYSLFFPYLWPRDSIRLKQVVVVCFLILVAQRVVNFLVPNQIGHITDAFEANSGLPWKEILIFAFYKVLQGQSGVLGSTRALLWIPVSQYSYLALTTAAFEHVHSLSLDFHLGKRTGEVLSALNKGASINSFLEQITFQVFPMLIDLLVAVIYFLVRFGAIYATIAAVISVFYLHMTVKMASTRADLRRDMVNADREEEAVKNDSIMSYETVKYFNAETYEFNRYRRAIKNFQAAEAKVTWGMNDMNIYQALVFMCGILIMLMVAAIEVTQGMRSIGDFVVMITYLAQLQGPLQFFGSFYRTVQQAMISGERLLELFKIQPSVVDQPGVVPLPECRGHIRWTNVQFSYLQERTALHNLSLTCLPGTTTAFVGESGGGKSTIFRLMFRYYNCEDGKIEIDGHDVKDLTIDSVRRHIGVVPQDTLLFNETIMYNLKYANPDVSDEEVYEACRAASIHDRILSFANGYHTKVGDRGTRLSGGEKQRVAIARTILKNPKIIMLDEATSALDSETEQQIQAKLIRGGSLGQDRTLLIIAHRLSTITHADQIIVLHAGSIIERGTHTELLAMKGRYASMWESQSQAEQAAIAARTATAHAKKLLRKAHLGNTANQARGSEETSDGYASLTSSTILGVAGSSTPRQGSSRNTDTSSSDEDH